MSAALGSKLIDQLCEAASQYRALGLKPLPLCDGKNPKTRSWQTREFSDADILDILEGAESPGIGVQMGPCSNIIDVEWDSAEQRELAYQIFGRELLDNCPAFGRPGDADHQHRLLAWNDELEAIGLATLELKVGSGGKSLVIRVGACGKGTQSAFPPSRNKTWLPDRSIGECLPPVLRPDIIDKLLSLSKRRNHSTSCYVGESADEASIALAVAAMKQHKANANENDGSRRLLAVCCRAVEKGLSDSAAILAIKQYELSSPFPRKWSDDEILSRLRDAEKRVSTKTGINMASSDHSLTDTGNAKRFAEQHGNEVRFCHSWDKWLVWDGKRWVVDDTGEVMRKAKLTAESIYDEIARCSDETSRAQTARWAIASERRGLLNSMVDLAKSEIPIPITVDQMDSHPMLLNCDNGTVDLRTGELREHRREDYATKLAPVEYPTEGNQAPALWLKFLDKIFAGNQELIEFMQRLIGLSLIGDSREHILPIFWGAGANGKTVLIETWRGMLGGDYAMKAPHDFLNQSRAAQHPTALASLHGKRFVAVVESGENCKLNEALVKELTGGDTIRARRMNEDFWEFRPSHLMALATNHKPEVREIGHGLWRRLRVVPFTVTIPEEDQDKTLLTKLQAEFSEILHWAVEGCQKYLKRNDLAEPKAVKVATEEYKDESDVLVDFVAECVTRQSDSSVSAKDIYLAYKAFTQERFQYVLTQTKFGRRMVEKGFTKKKIQGRSYYLGITLGWVASPNSPSHTMNGRAA